MSVHAGADLRAYIIICAIIIVNGHGVNLRDKCGVCDDVTG